MLTHLANSAAIAHELRGALVTTVGILLVLGLGEAARYVLHVRAEHTRKASHVGSGIVVLGTPYLFDSAWTVGIVCGLFAGLLWLGNRWGLLRSLHDVQRRTVGAFIYPVAIFVTYVLSAGDPLLFQVPILVLALSDTVAALVGQRVGSVTYKVGGGTRTLEGSAAFFGLTFLLVMVGLVVSGAGVWPDLLLVTLIVALVTTAVESVSVLGFDNLLIPYAAVFVLGRTLGLDLEGLGDWILGLVMVTTVVLATASRARLAPSGFILVSLVGYLAWVLGGPAWFWPLALLYLGWVATRPGADEGTVDVTIVFSITAVSMALLLLHSHTGWSGLYVPFLVSTGVNSAIAWTGQARRRGWSESLSAVAGAAVPMGVCLLLDTPLPVSPAGAVLVVAAGTIGCVLHRSLRDTGFGHRARVLGTAGGSFVGFVGVLL